MQQIILLGNFLFEDELVHGDKVTSSVASQPTSTLRLRAVTAAKVNLPPVAIEVVSATQTTSLNSDRTEKPALFRKIIQV